MPDVREDRTLERLAWSLPRAGFLVLPEDFRRAARRVGWVALASFLGVAALAIVLVRPRPVALALLLVGAVILGFASYRLAIAWPSVRAFLRGHRIDAKLPFAVNYLATMASGGLGLDRMFAQLSVQEVYGPVAHEASLIHRDLNLLGLDTTGALQAAIARSPSVKFQDFLQGLLTTTTSGGDLRLFLETKSEQYFAENRTLQARFLDRLALLAEVFVVVAVATPLFIIVLLSVLTVFGRSGPDVLLLGYATILLILPVTHATFALTVRAMQPGA